jgi:hypothetical protein
VFRQSTFIVRHKLIGFDFYSVNYQVSESENSDINQSIDFRRTLMLNDIPKPLIKKRQTHTKATSKEGVRKNTQWLKEHQKEYQGQWIALNEGVLLGAGESLVELYKALKKSGQLSVALFINLKMEAI